MVSGHLPPTNDYLGNRNTSIPSPSLQLSNTQSRSTSIIKKQFSNRSNFIHNTNRDVSNATPVTRFLHFHCRQPTPRRCFDQIQITPHHLRLCQWTGRKWSSKIDPRQQRRLDRFKSHSRFGPQNSVQQLLGQNRQQHGRKHDERCGGEQQHQYQCLGHHCQTNHNATNTQGDCRFKFSKNFVFAVAKGCNF